MSVTQATVKIPQQRWWRILPPTIIVYVFAYMDRINLGFALAGGMSESIGMTASMAGMAAGIFYFGYLLLQAPGGHIAEKGGAKKFLAWSIFGFGIAAFLTGFVTNAWQLLVLRFVLGVAEGGVMPAMLVLLSHWFPAAERARANAFFIMNNAFAPIIAGPLCGWLISSYGWPSVFLVEGALTLLLIFVWWPMIDDSPAKAKWLSEAERNYLITTLKAEKESQKRTDGLDVSYKELLRDVNLWKMIAIYFFTQVAVIGYMIWLPTMIKNLTKTGIMTVGLLTTVPFFAKIFGLYWFAQASDRTGNRKLYTALPLFLHGICFALSVPTSEWMWVSYGCLVGVGFFNQAHNGVFWSIPPMLFAPEVAGGARGLINGCGNLGGFFGPTLVGWFITVTHSTDTGVYVLSASLIIASLVTLTLPAMISGKKPAAPTGAAA